MSIDLLSGLLNNPTALLQQLQQGGDASLSKLAEFIKNPASMFSGFSEETTNPFSQMEDFSKLQSFLMPGIPGNTVTPDLSGSTLIPGNTLTPDLEKPDSETEKPKFSIPDEGIPKGDEPIDDKDKREDGTTKSWQEIRDDSPVCKNFGGKGKDIKEIEKGAKEKFGDWEKEKNPEVASRSYAKFRDLLEYADNSKSKTGKDRGKEANNGNLNGLTDGGEIRDGTELSTVVNYFRHGKKFVEDTTKGGQLKDHNDKFVRDDGSTRSNAAQAVVTFAKGLSHIIPGWSNVVAGLADGLDKGSLKEGLKGGFNGAKYTAENALQATDITNPKGMDDGAKNLFNGSFTEGL